MRYLFREIYKIKSIKLKGPKEINSIKKLIKIYQNSYGPNDCELISIYFDLG